MSTKTILIDDVICEICIDEKSVVCKNKREFSEIINILLTPKQQENYIVEDTNRRFKARQKRIDKMFEYINSSSNT